MQVKSLGPFSVGTPIGSEREEALKSLSTTSFVRAQPPQATPDSTQEEVKQGLLRMADYLHKMQGRGKRRKKSSEPGKPSARQRALNAYRRMSQSDSSEDEKGIGLSLFI